MDAIISQFIDRTSIDRNLAKQLLEDNKWNIELAINAYNNKSDSHETDSQHSQHSQHSQQSHSQIVALNSMKCSSEPSLSSYCTHCSSESSTTSSPSKLAISKSNDSSDDLKEDVCAKKLSRGISRATDNVNLVSKARTELAQDFKTSSRGSRLLTTNNILETPDFTFTLPDLSIHPEDFRVFLEQDLIEKSTLVSLEGAGRLNWWANIGIAQKMWPLATTGDGNCLLHAASLGMWGFHDRLLTLRKALHALLANSSYTTAFYRRWRWQTYLQNCEAGLIFSEHEWIQEWECLLKMASTEPRMRAKIDNKSTEINGGKKNDIDLDEFEPHIYESLEEIHIFALSHVLRRPIIVIADTMLKDITGEAFFPIPFGGIYLPLECKNVNLMKSPLCLTYDTAHFSALVSMDKETYADNHPSYPPAAIPIIDSDHNLLPIQFFVDPGEEILSNKDQLPNDICKNLTPDNKEKLNILKQYLDLTCLKIKDPDILIENKTPKRSDKILEKSRTLPISFESDDSCSDLPSASSVGGNGISKAKAFSNKAAKQIMMITKHFGSLGRMSKRIKKNLGTLARRGTSFRSKSNETSHKKLSSDASQQNSHSKQCALDSTDTRSLCEIDRAFDDRTTIIAAVLHIEKRHEYNDEMIRNYLSTARTRFLRHQKEKKSGDAIEPLNSASIDANNAANSTKAPLTTTPQIQTQLSLCVNTGCNMFGTVDTNYLCSSCFTDQKQTLTNDKSFNRINNIDCKREANFIDYNIDDDMKVSLSSITKTKEDADVIISCANSHFYVTTS